ncbi:MAG: TerB family tellurite resistance protein [Spirochaetales bacterium]|nr:TerB family tellurite resistance protein [Spirochaetales bacterium]
MGLLEKSMLPDYNKEEAAAALSIMISFCDDDYSGAEAAVLREYYTAETLDAVEEKLVAAGQSFPGDLKKISSGLTRILQAADKIFRLRTIAICQKVALADGFQDQREINLINSFAHALEVTLYEAERFAAVALKGVDETGDYACDGSSLEALNEVPELTSDEAGLLLAVLAAFSDDNPSEKEVGVIREYYSPALALIVQSKLKNAGFSWPGEKKVLMPAILKALADADRAVQLKALAVAYKTCMADDVMEAVELEFLELFCRELAIGMVEIQDYFKTSLV